MSDPLQLLDPLDVHEPPRLADVVLHQAQQIRAPGEDLNVAPFLAEQGYGCSFVVGLDIRMRALTEPSFLSRAASTRSGLAAGWHAHADGIGDRVGNGGSGDTTGGSPSR